MRIFSAFLVGTTLLLGCGDAAMNVHGTGGIGGSDTGAGGVGGNTTNSFDDLRLSLILEPRSCTVGIEAEYIVHVFVEGAKTPIEISGTGVDCDGVIEGVTSTITCPFKEDGVTVELELSDDTGVIVFQSTTGSPFCDPVIAISSQRGE